MSLHRPSDLAQVVALTRAVDDEAFRMSIDEFADGFYLTADDHGRQAMLDGVPPSTGVPWRDAWTGAVGEHLASRWGLMVPAWTARACHFALSGAVYEPVAPGWRTTLFVHSPPAFRRRNLFVPLEPLARARFPGAKLRSPLPPPTDADPFEDLGSSP